MFTPKTEKLAEIATSHTKVIAQLGMLLEGNVRMYIDYANIRPWSTHLKWHVDIKRLKQFLDSFENIKSVNFYQGTLAGDEKSESEIALVHACKYNLRTKPVKIMRFAIDATSVPKDSTVLLDYFVRRSLLRKFSLETIEYLNDKFAEMNKSGELYIEDRKCNFDVEIGVDMLLDFERNGVDTYVLWSGDSDFSDPIKQLLADGKKVILFATARRVSSELSALREEGLVIFDIKKIQDFICRNKERSDYAAQDTLFRERESGI